MISESKHLVNRINISQSFTNRPYPPKIHKLTRSTRQIRRTAPTRRHQTDIRPGAVTTTASHHRQILDLAHDRSSLRARRLSLHTLGAPQGGDRPNGLTLLARKLGFVVRGGFEPALFRVKQELRLRKGQGLGLSLGRASDRRALANVLELRVAAELRERVDEDAHFVLFGLGRSLFVLGWYAAWLIRRGRSEEGPRRSAKRR